MADGEFGGGEGALGKMDGFSPALISVLVVRVGPTLRAVSWDHVVAGPTWHWRSTGELCFESRAGGGRGVVVNVGCTEPDVWGPVEPSGRTVGGACGRS